MTDSMLTGSGPPIKSINALKSASGRIGVLRQRILMHMPAWSFAAWYGGLGFTSWPATPCLAPSMTPRPGRDAHADGWRCCRCRWLTPVHVVRAGGWPRTRPA